LEKNQVYAPVGFEIPNHGVDLRSSLLQRAQEAYPVLRGMQVIAIASELDIGGMSCPAGDAGLLV